MKKSRFSEEQIIAVLKEHQAGIAVADICRKHGISDATFYNWRNRYGGMEVSDARRLKALDDENRKLKKRLAESMLDVATLREALGKMYGPPRRCKVQVRSDDPVCINVSGLSRVDCCCSQAMMRSARAVLE